MKTDAALPASFEFEGFRVDVRERQVYRGDEPVPMGGKAFDVLLLLLRRQGELIEKDELLSQVWPDTNVSDDSLKQTVSVLRRALGEDPVQPQFIATVPRRGYRFIAPVSTPEPEPAEPPAPAVVALPAAAELPPEGGSHSMRMWLPASMWLPALAGRQAIARWAILLLLAFVGIAWIVFTRPVASGDQPGPPAIRFEHTAPPGTTIASGGTFSPDGRHLAFLARSTADGRISLWVRTMASPQPRQIAGTEGAIRPFWSPDSRFLAFFADGRLKKVGLEGAGPQVLASVGYRPAGGTWSPQGVLVYSDRQSRLYGVPEEGDGKIFPVTTLDAARHEVAHSAPQFLPDGRTFLFKIDSVDAANSGTYIASLDDPAARNRLMDGAAANVTFVPPDHVIYLRDHVLMTRPFDPAARQLTGNAVPIADLTTRSLTFSAAPAGLLTFGGETVAQQLAWFDRAGKRLGVPPAGRNLHNPVLAPDGRQLVADGSGMIWVVDLERGVPTRIGTGTLPAWGPGGDAVVFTRREATTADVVMKALAGEDSDRVLVRSPEMKLSGGWSRDGRHFVYVASSPETKLDVRVRDTEQPDEARPFLQTSFNEMQPRISPDGRWIAYTSDETGSWEVYVQSFPMPGAKRAVSLNGGAEPQWTKNGEELVYLRPDGTIVAVKMSVEGEALHPSMPQPLFRVPLAGDITTYRNNYAVTADGSRFLVDTADESTREPISVVVHWDSLLSR